MNQNPYYLRKSAKISANGEALTEGNICQKIAIYIIKLYISYTENCFNEKGLVQKIDYFENSPIYFLILNTPNRKSIFFAGMNIDYR